jgi:hypothetical protein
MEIIMRRPFEKGRRRHLKYEPKIARSAHIAIIALNAVARISVGVSFGYLECAVCGGIVANEQIEVFERLS